MEALIRQAFIHVHHDNLNIRVPDGQYDIQGPNEEIILPGVWDSVIRPGWETSMHMWPELQPPPRPMPAYEVPFGGLDSMFMGELPKRSKSKKEKTAKAPVKEDKKKKRASAVIDVPPMVPMPGGHGLMMDHMAGPPPGLVVHKGGPPPPPMHHGPMGIPPSGPMMSGGPPPPPPMGMPGGFAHMHADHCIIPGGVEILMDEEDVRPRKTAANTKAKAKTRKELPKFALWAAGGTRKR